MTRELRLGDIAVDVVLKDIKNLHLSVHPPTGRVRIAAPSTMHFDAIRVFANSNLGGIRRQQGTLLDQERETEREFIERESHYVWGRRYLLTPGGQRLAQAVPERFAALRGDRSHAFVETLSTAFPSYGNTHA